MKESQAMPKHYREVNENDEIVQRLPFKYRKPTDELKTKPKMPECHRIHRALEGFGGRATVKQLAKATGLRIQRIVKDAEHFAGLKRPKVEIIRSN
jgi:hypothetical protein